MSTASKGPASKTTVCDDGQVKPCVEKDYTLLEDTLSAMKERGNINFRNKDFREGITHFNEAIELFKNAKWIALQGDIKTKITQIFTNRATSLHMLNEQRMVAKDCSYVLKNLDANNQKALFRRAHAYKVLG